MMKNSVEKLLIICILFLSSGYAAAQNAAAGDDKAVCPGQSVEIGTDTDPSWCYFWEDNKGNKSFPSTPKITVTPSETTTYTVTATGPDFDFKDKDEVKVTVIKDIKIKEVSFSGNIDIVKDNGSDSYKAPHWESGKTPSPVCYKGGDVMNVASEIELDEDPGSTVKVKVKGTGTGGFDIAATSVTSGKKLTLPATAVSTAFPVQVDYYDPFEIDWEVSFDDGSTWCSAGKSTNKLYVSWKGPTGGVTLFHTVIGLSCKNTKGLAAEPGIFAGIWGEFNDRNVTTIDPPIRQLTYYGNWTNMNTTTESLLKNGDGQCGSWAKLMLDMLKVQGITLPSPYVFVRYKNNLATGGFIVKDWTFTGAGTSGDATYPYLTIGGPVRGSSSYTWDYTEVNDQPGIPGQGTANPASLFNNHQFIYYDGKYYDPSYGTEAATITDVETNAIEAFFNMKMVTVSEAAIGRDLNGNGTMTDTLTGTMMVFKKNGAGLDFDEKKYSY